jgi:hypothetical protein
MLLDFEDGNLTELRLAPRHVHRAALSSAIFSIELFAACPQLGTEGSFQRFSVSRSDCHNRG